MRNQFYKQASAIIIESTESPEKVYKTISDIGLKMSQKMAGVSCSVNGSGIETLQTLAAKGMSDISTLSGVPLFFNLEFRHINPEAEVNKKPLILPLILKNSILETPPTFVFQGKEMIFTTKNFETALKSIKEFGDSPGSLPDDSPFDSVEPIGSKGTDGGFLTPALAVRDEYMFTGRNENPNEMPVKFASVAGSNPITVDTLLKIAAELTPFTQKDFDRKVAEIEALVKEAYEIEVEDFYKKFAAMKPEFDAMSLQTKEMIEALKDLDWKNIKLIENLAHVQVLTRGDEGVYLENAKVFKKSYGFLGYDRAKDQDKTQFKIIDNHSAALVLSENNGYKVISADSEYLTAKSVKPTVLKYVKLWDIINDSARREKNQYFVLKDNHIFGPYNFKTRDDEDNGLNPVSSYWISNANTKKLSEAGIVRIEAVMSFEPRHAGINSYNTFAESHFNFIAVKGLKHGLKMTNSIDVRDMVMDKLQTNNPDMSPQEIGDFALNYNDVVGETTSLLLGEDTILFEVDHYITTPMGSIQDAIFAEREDKEIGVKEAADASVLFSSMKGSNFKIEKQFPDREIYNLILRPEGQSKIFNNLTKLKVAETMVLAGVPHNEIGIIFGLLDSGEKSIERNYNSLTLEKLQNSPLESKVQDRISGFVNTLLKSDSVNAVGTEILASQLSDVVTSSGPGALDLFSLISKHASEMRALSQAAENIAIEKKSEDMLSIAKVATALYHVDLMYHDTLKGSVDYSIDNLKSAVAGSKNDLCKIASMASDLITDQRTSQKEIVSNNQLFSMLKGIDALCNL